MWRIYKMRQEVRISFQIIIHCQRTSCAALESHLQSFYIRNLIYIRNLYSIFRRLREIIYKFCMKTPRGKWSTPMAVYGLHNIRSHLTVLSKKFFYVLTPISLRHCGISEIIIFDYFYVIFSNWNGCENISYILKLSDSTAVSSKIIDLFDLIRPLYCSQARVIIHSDRLEGYLTPILEKKAIPSLFSFFLQKRLFKMKGHCLMCI